YGLRYLFLTPEYLDKVSFFSYFIVGMMAGLFVVAFHINSYIYYGYRFPFLATLSRPLWKFSLNNSIIPVLFYSYYIWHTYWFLLDDGQAIATILLHIGALLLGTVLMVAFTFTYFIGTIRTLELPDDQHGREKGPLHGISELLKKGGKVREPRDSRIDCLKTVSLKLTRNTGHYKRNKLMATN
ncbi:MAG: hypothetical protein U5L96_20745, partial [Owenweeksia sp.]|nr:hypothetical protein [Owenweeksia sp.]